MAVKKPIKDVGVPALNDTKRKEFVQVQVTRAKWGRYKKGDVLTMHVTTAKACEKKKAVELVGEVKNVEMVNTENA
jgi:hypothetical protein